MMSQKVYITIYPSSVCIPYMLYISGSLLPAFRETRLLGLPLFFVYQDPSVLYTPRLLCLLLELGTGIHTHTHTQHTCLPSKGLLFLRADKTQHIYRAPTQHARLSPLQFVRSPSPLARQNNPHISCCCFGATFGTTLHEYRAISCGTAQLRNGRLYACCHEWGSRFGGKSY